MTHQLKKYTVAFVALTLATSYACEPKVKYTKPNLIAHTATTPTTSKENNTVKIALLLDTSNSMDGLINQAKAQLWDIVNEFTHAKCGNNTRPNLQIALYQYGNDNLSANEGYIQQVLNFSSDLDEISEKLFSLTTNGGEEYCGEVINTSLKQLSWGKNADNLKIIFIAGNEPFDQGKLNFEDASLQAKEKDVVVNTIFCGSYEQGINTNWKKGAMITGGEYSAIDHNLQMAYVKTPYDDEIMKQNSKLNSTYVSYGALGNAKRLNQSTQDKNAESLQEVVMVKRAVSKSSKLYHNAEWDLVDAVEDNIAIETIEKEALPEVLKDKSTAEIKSYIATKKTERDTIQSKIKLLNSKREQYLAAQAKNKSGELESALLTAIKKQATKKNLKFD